MQALELVQDFVRERRAGSCGIPYNTVNLRKPSSRVPDRPARTPIWDLDGADLKGTSLALISSTVCTRPGRAKDPAEN